MMQIIAATIGPNFGNEVLASSLRGLPFSWSAAGVRYDDGALTGDQVTALQQLVAAHDPAKQDPGAVKREAERRIADGILVNGKPFRCDNDSVLRMRMLADLLAVAPAGTTQTFRTAAGDEFTVNDLQARAISDAQINWQGVMLAASATLQGNPPANPTADANWPAQASIAV